ncbi:MAG: hypothetical protein ACI8ZF_000605 [Candidatus Midichloriaceae bacterium]|jgi:hypothetical protein
MTKLVNTLYQLSFYGNDIKAIQYAEEEAKTGKLDAAIATANLIIHRGKDIKTGFAIYDSVLRCDSKNNHHSITIEALDNKWRMIHHHPNLIK